MLHLMRSVAAVAAVAGLLAGTATMTVAGSKGTCVKKAAEGTGSDEKAAKFQVDEALLQAVDWGAWASWMATGTTPGYDFGKRTYKCTKGTGLGVTCRGQATICKL